MKSVFLPYLFHAGIYHTIAHPDPQTVAFFGLGHGPDILSLHILHIGKSAVQLLQRRDGPHSLNIKRQCMSAIPQYRLHPVLQPVFQLYAVGPLLPDSIGRA